MITTLPQFYYGHTVTVDNDSLDFKENGGSELTATVDPGSYSLTDFADAIESSLNAAGTLGYTVTVNRTTRKLTITAGSGTVQILGSTGTHVLTSGIYTLLGFTTDSAAALAVTGDSASGSVWRPQFLPQSWVNFEQNQSAVDGVKRESTSGQVEAVTFGIKKIMDANFTFITNAYQRSGSPIENDSAGYNNALAFLSYAITKGNMEWMPDRNDPSIFTKTLLESTPTSKDGLGFELNELYAKGLVGYYETGILKFREVT